MVKIEVLFSEVCNLYGDLFNIKYLKECIKDVVCIYTSLTDTPRFVSEDVDMIYMAPMTEKTQELVIQKLKPYTEKLQELINIGKVFLLTGNAFEVFGKYIENEDNSQVEGLGLIDIYSKRDMMNRYHSLFLGKLEDGDIPIVGFKAQFSMSFGDNNNTYAFKVTKGIRYK